MEITDSQLKTILKKQATMVKCPFSIFDPIYVKHSAMPKDWYLKYSWTEQTQNIFKQWLVNFLKTKTRFKIMSKKYLEACADWFIFDYGWKLK